MAPEDLRNTLKQTPFEPFRLVMTDGKFFEIRHPDLLLLGKRAAVVGLTGQPDQTLYEQTVKVDLLHIIRIEPLPSSLPTPKNSSG